MLGREFPGTRRADEHGVRLIGNRVLVRSDSRGSSVTHQRKAWVSRSSLTHHPPDLPRPRVLVGQWIEKVITHAPREATGLASGGVRRQRHQARIWLARLGQNDLLSSMRLLQELRKRPTRSVGLNGYPGMILAPVAPIQASLRAARSLPRLARDLPVARLTGRAGFYKGLVSQPQRKGVSDPASLSLDLNRLPADRPAGAV